MLEFYTFLGGIILGYAIGRIDLLKSILTRSDAASASSLFSPSTQKKSMKRVEIDERTYVTKVDDDALQSSGASLGKTTSTQDDIGAASNKLAQLKKLKG